MPDLNLLKQQHRELEELCRKVQLQLDTAEPRGDYICALLTTLAVKLQNHLLLEDSGLYPYLKHHAGPEGKSLQEELCREMAGLRRDVDAFLTRWHDRENIAGDLPGFRRDSGEVFAALTRRIEQEDSRFFPKVLELMTKDRKPPDTPDD